MPWETWEPKWVHTKELQWERPRDPQMGRTLAHLKEQQLARWMDDQWGLS